MQVSTKEVMTSRPLIDLNLRPVFASDGRVGCLSTLVRAVGATPHSPPTPLLPIMHPFVDFATEKANLLYMYQVFAA